MSSTSEEYTLTWNDHGKNISISFSDILDQKELIDVTLVADGYLFNAHRLILSAISPYFRQMFTQMPANQHAFVFLKDVSKQTLDDLVAFMYSGEVNVNQKNVNAFLDTAKAFKIKGLFDDIDDNASERSSPAPHGSQYQSTQTVPVRVQDQTIYCSASSINHPQHPPLDEFNIESKNRDEMDQPGYDSPIGRAEYFDGYDVSGQDEPMDQYAAAQDDVWNAHREYEVDEIPQLSKRIVGINGYDIIADIRLNEYDRVNLFYNGYKFHRNGNKFARKQNWQCTRHNKNQCRASASTMKIGGVTKMKISIAEHTHEPERLIFSLE